MMVAHSKSLVLLLACTALSGAAGQAVAASAVPTPIAFNTANLAAMLAALAPTGPVCAPCWPGTTGPCQGTDTICWAFQPDGTCPTGTNVCSCPACDAGTSGPCHHATGACGPYSDAVNMRCPAGAFDCSAGSKPVVTIQENCPPCDAGSTGPCQSATGTQCFPFYTGTTRCPVGTVECGSFAPPTPGVTVTTGCTTCGYGTVGPCIQANGICNDFYPGTALCPTGSTVCETCTVALATVAAAAVAVPINGGTVNTGTVAVTVSTGTTTPVADTVATVTTPTNPCADPATAPSGAGACLPIAVAVPTPVAAIVVQLPPGLNTVITAAASISIVALSKSSSSSAVTKGCAHSLYSPMAGTVMGTNCAPGEYVLLVATSEGNSAGSSTVTAKSTTDNNTSLGAAGGVGAGVGIAIVAMAAAFILYRKRRNSPVVPVRQNDQAYTDNLATNDNVYEGDKESVVAAVDCDEVTELPHGLVTATTFVTVSPRTANIDGDDDDSLRLETVVEDDRENETRSAEAV